MVSALRDQNTNDKLNYFDDNLLVKIFREHELTKTSEKIMMRVIVRVLASRKKLYLLTRRD